MNIKILASGSSGNCYKIENTDTSLLIECGISFKEIIKKLDYKLSDITACLITHEHIDHSKSIRELSISGIETYMSEGTRQAISISTNTFVKKNNNEYESVDIGSFRVTPFKALHDAVEPVNFYILDKTDSKSLVFITDTKFTQYRFSTNYIMLEVNYVSEKINSEDINPTLRKRIKENHMSLETALDFLDKCDLTHCEKIYALHLSEKNADAEFIKNTLQEKTGIPVEIC